MGSKNPLVIMDDADLGRAIDIAINGAFGGTGQKCTASSRLIVHRPVLDAFTERFVARAKALRVGLVGPLPPPSGGMANQTRQLARLLAQEGMEVEIVQVNAPYRPAWIEHLRGARALIRLIPYLRRLWNAAGRVHLFHVMANSGWAWHLFAAPAVWVAKLRGLNTGKNLIALRTNMEAGHGGAAGRFDRLKEVALSYAFAIDVAGVTPAV